MGTYFFDAIVNEDVGLPLSARRLIPDGHDGAAMLCRSGMPMNTSIVTLRRIDEVLAAFQKTRSSTRMHSPNCSGAADAGQQTVHAHSDSYQLVCAGPMRPNQERIGIRTTQGGRIEQIPLDSDGHPYLEWETSPFNSPMPSLTGAVEDDKPAQRPLQTDCNSNISSIPGLPHALCAERQQRPNDLEAPSSTSSISSRQLYSLELQPSTSTVASVNEEILDPTPSLAPFHSFPNGDGRNLPLEAIEERPAVEARLRPSGQGYIPEPASPRAGPQTPTRIPPRPRPTPHTTSRIPRRPSTSRSAPLPSPPPELHSTLCLPPRFMDASRNGDLASRPPSIDTTPTLLRVTPRVLPRSLPSSPAPAPADEPRPNAASSCSSGGRRAWSLRGRMSAVAAALSSPVRRLALVRRRPQPHASS
eukprot:jgi/Ulvmu1/2024/UM120_0020.1